MKKKLNLIKSQGNVPLHYWKKMYTLKVIIRAIK